MRRGGHRADSVIPAAPPAQAPAGDPPAAPVIHEDQDDDRVTIDLSGPLRSLNVDRLSGANLKAYAAKAGVRKHDIERLTEDRLRQNVKITIANHFELLSEG